MTESERRHKKILSWSQIISAISYFKITSVDSNVNLNI